MSYCRWSSDSYRCDLYCYEACEEWVTHVASRRREMPDDLRDPPLDMLISDPAKWAVEYNIFMDEMDKCQWAEIGLPHDGETFYDSTLEEFRARVAGLIELGYNIPDGVLPAIDEEISEAG